MSADDQLAELRRSLRRAQADAERQRLHAARIERVTRRRLLIELSDAIGIGGLPGLAAALTGLLRDDHAARAMTVAAGLRDPNIADLAGQLAATVLEQSVEVPHDETDTALRQVIERMAVSDGAASTERVSEGSAAAERSGNASLRIGVLGGRASAAPSVGNSSETDAGDDLASLVVLSHLAAADAVAQLDIDDELRPLVEHFGMQPLEGSLAEPGSLVFVDRSDPRTCTEPTVLLVVGSLNAGLPWPPHLQPVFVSVSLPDPGVLDQAAIDWFKANEPVGCADPHTTYLLRSVGVDAKLVWPIELAARRLGNGRSPAALVPRWDNMVDATAPFAEVADELLARLPHWRTAKSARTPSIGLALAAEQLGGEVIIADPSRRSPSYVGAATASAAERATQGTLLSTMLDEMANDIVIRHDVGAARGRLAARPIDDPPSLTLSPDDLASVIRSIDSDIDDAQTAEPGAVVIAVASDANLIEPAVTCLNSIIKNTSSSVEFRYLARGLTEKDTRHLRDCVAAPVHFHHMDSVRFDDVALPPHIPSWSTMDRLVLPELLADHSKLVYLDLDLVVVGDVSDLASHDLGGCPAAARPVWSPESGPVNPHRFGFAIVDAVARNLAPADADALRRWSYDRHGQMHFNRINAGVAVFDLAALRREQFSAMALGLVRRFHVNDQQAMSLVLGGRIAPLAPEWNYLPAVERQEEPKVVHWAGPHKPWATALAHERRYWHDAVASSKAETDQTPD